MKLEFCRQILEKKNPEISNFTKIRPVGAKLFHADGQTKRHNEVIFLYILLNVHLSIVVLTFRHHASYI